MKQLRAEGIQERLALLLPDAAWLRAASKDDFALHARLKEANYSLQRAMERAEELLEERASA